MDQLLNIRTTAFLTAILSMVIAGCMVHLWLTRKAYPGFNLWTGGYVCLGVGLLMMSLRGLIPAWISIVAAQTLIACYLPLTCEGLARFLGAPPRAGLSLLSPVTIIIVLPYFTYASPDLLARMIFVYGLLGILYLRGAWLVFHYSVARLGNINWMLCLGLLAPGLWFALFTGLIAVQGVDSRELMSAGWMHGLSILIACLAGVVIAAGLISINAQRLELELTSARDEIHVLRDFLPICANCKKIRDDEGYWNQVETYLARHTGARFTHGICPDCARQLYPEIDMG